LQAAINETRTRVWRAQPAAFFEEAILDAEVIETDYDPSRMQDQLFIIPSFTWLRSEAERLVQRLVGLH
jgi:hypothetical protein